MKYTYNFNLEYKPYLNHESGPPIDEVCNRLADLIYGPYDIPFIGAAQEVAKSAAYFRDPGCPQQHPVRSCEPHMSFKIF